MRILQVVTLLCPDGAYGGPARVALNQSAELIGQGHNVTVAAATRGYRIVPAELDGVPVRLFAARTLLPGTGFAGLVAPTLSRWFRRNRNSYDIIHIHFGRDLVVLRVMAEQQVSIGGQTFGTATKTGTSAKMGNIVRMYRSPVYKWMSLRGREFGWYPYRNEPWHWEYNPPGLKARFAKSGTNTVVISRGLMGSYNANINGGPNYKVKRVK